VENGISDSLSPASLVTGLANPDFWHMRLEFGAYAQVFEDNDPSNTIRARSLGAIALNPTGNAQGDYFFMSLATGCKDLPPPMDRTSLTDLAIARSKPSQKWNAAATHTGAGYLSSKCTLINLSTPTSLTATMATATIRRARRRFPGDFDPIEPDELHDLAADALERP
jgi:hypothetical protein